MNPTRKKLEKIYNQIDKIATKGKDNILEYTRYIDELIVKGDYSNFEQCLYYYYFIDTLQFKNISDVKKKTYDDIIFATKSSFLKKLGVLYKKRDVYQDSYNIYTSNISYTQISLSPPLSATYSVLSVDPSLSFSIDGDKIKMSVIEPNTYKVNISKSTWEIVDGIDTPVKSEHLQKIDIYPDITEYPTDITTTYAHDMLITSYERSGFHTYYYKLEVTKNNLLGQIRELDLLNLDSSYLYMSKELSRFYGDFNIYLEVVKGSLDPIVIDFFDPKLSDETNLLRRYSLALDYLFQ